MAQIGVPGPQPALITIPVVVHVLWYNTSQNLSDAVIQSQIDELNLGFRKLSPDVAQVPGVFGPFVADARINFCLATRMPNGAPTTGITRRNTWVNGFRTNQMKSVATGGTDAWNTTQYLNIWCCDAVGILGYAFAPGEAPTPGEDGVVVSHTAFGRGHLALDLGHTLGRVAIHEVGHWLNLRHIWGDGTVACAGNDLVDDTPKQAGPNYGIPAFPSITCGNGPNGDMFMNHMDYVDDARKLMFTPMQALRMQATFAPGGPRALLKSSPAFNPILSINSAGIPSGSLFCGDRTDYNFRPTTNSVGCGGGFIQYRWAADNGWAVNYPNDFYPEIIPNGTSGSLITLTGTYTNANGATFQLNTASVLVGFNGAAGTPVFTSAPTMVCDGASYPLAVADVPGATGYLWTLPPGFGRLRQNPTPTPSIAIGLSTSLAPGTYTLSCQAVAGGCANSAPATLPFSVNGGPLLRIVDGNANQRTTNNVVCPQNRLILQLRPPVVGDIAPATSVNWSSGLLATVPVPNRLLEYTYFAPNTGGTSFRVTVNYVDACGVTRYPVDYIAMTAIAGTSTLTNNYSCNTNSYRPATPSPSLSPYPNPVTGRLQLPGYQGAVVIYNQQGQAVHRLLSPGPSASVDTSTWPDGLYVVTGSSVQGEFLRHNVQVQR